MTQNTAIVFVTSMILSSACAVPDVDAGGVAAVLSESLTDAVLEGEMGDGIWASEREARFRFKDDLSKRRGGEPWVGEVNGRVSRSGSGYEDWRFDVALEDFGGKGEGFTGELEIDSYADSDFGFQTIDVQGEVESSKSGSLEVDLEIDFEDEGSFFAVEWVGTVDGTPVKGGMQHMADRGDDYDDCRAPIGVDCE
jgi:hypothetical protein